MRIYIDLLNLSEPDDEWLDTRFAYSVERNQYYATAILRELERRPGWRILGVSALTCSSRF